MSTIIPIGPFEHDKREFFYPVIILDIDGVCMVTAKAMLEFSDDLLGKRNLSKQHILYLNHTLDRIQSIDRHGYITDLQNLDDAEIKDHVSSVFTKMNEEGGAGWDTIIPYPGFINAICAWRYMGMEVKFLSNRYIKEQVVRQFIREFGLPITENDIFLVSKPEEKLEMIHWITNDDSDHRHFFYFDDYFATLYAMSHDDVCGKKQNVRLIHVVQPWSREYGKQLRGYNTMEGGAGEGKMDFCFPLWDGSPNSINGYVSRNLFRCINL